MRLIHALGLSAALSAALALSVPAALAQEVMAATIVVTGTGTVDATPDIATLSLGVTTQGDTAAAAMAANTAAIQAVMARLTTAGIAQRDIQTSNLSLFPNWSDPSSSTAGSISFSASNMMTVRIRDLTILGAVLDAAVTDGANTLNGLTFGLSNPDPVLDQARQQAVAQARARAELLATAAGATLGRIISISEGGAATDPVPLFRAEASDAAVPVAGGELAMTASVTIKYEIIE